LPISSSPTMRSAASLLHAVALPRGFESASENAAMAVRTAGKARRPTRCDDESLPMRWRDRFAPKK
jgi:hypothetical protein